MRSLEEKMDPAITIRSAAPGDTHLLAGIIRESFKDVALRFSLTPENCPRHPSNCTADWVETDQARGVRYFILWRQGAPIGCVAVERPEPGLCYLERLAVLPKARYKGYGRALVQHALAHARRNGAQKVSIGIIAEQTELRHWYTRLGFEETQNKRFKHLPFQVSLMEKQFNTQ